ncbi:SsgA family sporulation/cell division regulator [Amycolatopsis sp. WQ 127309]|uniref:SsgA family sporulation/cell division regulator n=1 Tax=Amycolatopsis sp. WQ 127309 TaxID=2932773 RepID=UPI001FF1F7D8|nr:SsgA family sporulation/cell division regulator [Amycolatopsis sp. WQ 127309]UOZ06966.1 SsgA family sporulation/cell division regulator [Amycolatopsis sp. WQ 127309]
MSYDSRDPFAVKVRFIEQDGDATDWIFARDLLAHGLKRPAGYGDIRVRPWWTQEGPAVLLELSSPFGAVALTLLRETLVDFLRQMDDMVPFGTEEDWIDTDLALVRLLGDGR